jgi:hypothetical protein
LGEVDKMKLLNKLCNEVDKVFENVITNHFQLGSREFSFPDAVILGLLENLNNHSKTLLILLEKKHYASLDTVLRTIFENYVYLLYVLEKDTLERSKAYAYSNKIKEIHLFNMLTEDSLYGNQLRKFLGVTKENIENKFLPYLNEKYKKEITDVYIEELKMIRTEQKWYNFNGKTNNFKKLCREMNLSKQYDLIYSFLSTETHAKDAIKNFSFEEGFIGLLYKKNENKLHIFLSELFVLESIRLVYKYYGLKIELKNFNTLLKINYKYNQFIK